MNIPIDEVVHFDIITSDSTGVAIDADATPTWAVYEEDTDAHILTGNFTKRTALTGDYRGSITLSIANGFEAGKWYSVIGAATVGGNAGKCPCLSFRCVPVEASAGVPVVDVVRISGDDVAANNMETAFDGGSYNVGGGGTVSASVTAPVSLANDSIKAATFDESTAFPLKAADVGNTLIARTGADADTLKTLSDQIVTPLDAAGVRNAIGLNSANLDTQLGDVPTNSELTAAFTEIKGATWSSTTDSLEKIRDRGDAAWTTATGFTTTADLDARGITIANVAQTGNSYTLLTNGTYGLDKLTRNTVWTDAKAAFVDAAISSRLASTSYVIPLDAAGVRTAIGMATNNMDIQLADIPTVAEFNARTIASANYATSANQSTIIGHTDVLPESWVVPLDAAGVRTAVGLSTANLDAQLADLPTVSEFNARTVVSGSYATLTNQSTIIGYLDTEISSILNAVDTEINAIKLVTDKLDTTLVQDGGVYDFTSAALAAAPTTIVDVPTVEEIRIEIDANSTQLSAIKGVSDKVNTTLVQDGAVYDFTAAALAAAPVPEVEVDIDVPTVEEIRAEMDTNSTQLSAIKLKTDTIPTWPTNFAALGINASGHIGRVVLVDTTTTNSDMRGTDGAALAGTALSNAVWTDQKAGYLDSSIAGIDVPTAIENADAVLSRGVHHVKGTADEYSLCTMSFAMLNSEFINNDWIIYDEGNAEYDRRTVEKNSTAQPVTRVSS